MRKKWKRKAIACLTALAMMGTLIPQNPFGVMWEKVAAAEDSLLTPTYLFDFESGLAQYGASPITNGTTGKVEIMEDAERGKVLHITDGGTESFGQNYYKLPEDIFNGVTAETGTTISMWVKIPTEIVSEWSVLFSSNPGYNQWNLWKMNANLVTGINSGDPWAFGDTSSYEMTKDVWHHVAATLTKEVLTIYLDGTLITTQKPTGGADSYATNGWTGPLNQLASNTFNVLGAGGFPSDGKTGDRDISDCYYDDVAIYSTALTQQQIWDQMSDSIDLTSNYQPDENGVYTIASDIATKNTDGTYKIDLTKVFKTIDFKAGDKEIGSVSFTVEDMDSTELAKLSSVTVDQVVTLTFKYKGKEKTIKIKIKDNPCTSLKVQLVEDGVLTDYSEQNCNIGDSFKIKLTATSKESGVITDVLTISESNAYKIVLDGESEKAADGTVTSYYIITPKASGTETIQIAYNDNAKVEIKYSAEMVDPVATYDFDNNIDNLTIVKSTEGHISEIGNASDIVYTTDKQDKENGAFNSVQNKAGLALNESVNIEKGFTIAARVQVSTNPEPDENGLNNIFSYIFAASKGKPQVQVEGDGETYSGQYFVGIQKNGLTPQINLYQEFVSVGAGTPKLPVLEEGSWHDVAMAVSPEGEVNFYVDNQLYSTLQMTTSQMEVLKGDLYITLGCSFWGEYANITYDQVELYDCAITLADSDKILVIKVDKAALSSAIEQAEAIDKNEYSVHSYENVEAAIIAAKEILEKGSATQEEVDEAEDTLISAINALKKIYTVTITGTNISEGVALSYKLGIEGNITDLTGTEIPAIEEGTEVIVYAQLQAGYDKSNLKYQIGSKAATAYTSNGIVIASLTENTTITLTGIEKNTYSMYIESTSDGTVTASVAGTTLENNASIPFEETIEVKVVPEQEKEIKSFIVKTSIGDVVETTSVFNKDDGSTTYTFKMPAGDITITTIFTEVSEHTISIAPTEKAEIIIDKESGFIGDEISIIVKPKAEYIGDYDLVINVNTENSVISIERVTEDAEDGTLKYTFILQSQDVTIEEAFNYLALTAEKRPNAPENAAIPDYEQGLLIKQQEGLEIAESLLTPEWTDFTTNLSLDDLASIVYVRTKGSLTGGIYTPASKYEEVKIQYTPFVTAEAFSVYGVVLSQIVISGSAVYDGKEVEGSFAWETENASTVKPNAGTVETYTAVFTPEDESLYRTVAGIRVKLTIEKADPEYQVPSDLTAVEGSTLDEIELPEGFSFTASAGTSVGTVGSHEFEVTYTPKDTENYNVVKDKVVIIVTEKPSEGDIPTTPGGITGGDTPTTPGGITGGDTPTTPGGITGGDTPTTPGGITGGDTPTTPGGITGGDIPTTPGGITGGDTPTTPGGITGGGTPTTPGGITGGDTPTTPGGTIGGNSTPSSGTTSSSSGTTTSDTNTDNNDTDNITDNSPSTDDNTPEEPSKIIKPDGTVVETITETSANGVVKETVTETAADNSVIKETVTETAANGSVTMTSTVTDQKNAVVLNATIEKDANGNVTKADAIISAGAAATQIIGKKATVTVNVSDIVMDLLAENEDINSVVIEITKPVLSSAYENKSVTNGVTVNVNIDTVKGVEVSGIVLTSDSIAEAKAADQKLTINVIMKNTDNADYKVAIPAKQLKKITDTTKPVNIMIETVAVKKLAEDSSKSQISADIEKVLTKSNAKKTKTYVLSVAENENLTAGMKITAGVNADTTISANQTVYVYRYNKNTGKLVEVANSKQIVSADGKVTIDAKSGIDYVVCSKKLTGSKVKTIKSQITATVEKSSVKAGKNLSIYVVLPSSLKQVKSFSNSSTFGKEQAVILYESSDKKIATVTTNGTVKAKKAGKVTITITIGMEGGQTKTIKKNITVK